jgi:hypothetical protein
MKSAAASREQNGGVRIPPCMGYRIRAEENPFVTKPVPGQNYLTISFRALRGSALTTVRFGLA